MYSDQIVVSQFPAHLEFAILFLELLSGIFPDYHLPSIPTTLSYFILKIYETNGETTTPGAHPRRPDSAGTRLKMRNCPRVGPCGRGVRDRRHWMA